MKLAMTIKQAAESLEMGETTIRKMISLNQFPSPYKIGNAIRFDIQDLKDWQLLQKQNITEKKKMGRPRLAV